MLSPEQIEDMANTAFADYMADKNDDADIALARAVEAATLATVTPLVQQMLLALEHEWGGEPLSNTLHSINAARAFLSGASKESTDHGL